MIDLEFKDAFVKMVKVTAGKSKAFTDGVTDASDEAQAYPQRFNNQSDVNDYNDGFDTMMSAKAQLKEENVEIPEL